MRVANDAFSTPREPVDPHVKFDYWCLTHTLTHVVLTP